MPASKLSEKNHALLCEDSEFIESQSYSILPRREAMRSLELQRDQLIASDDMGASLVVFGQPREDSLADARRRTAQAIGAVGEAFSLQLSPVDLVADAAWFAQMPGN